MFYCFLSFMLILSSPLVCSVFYFWFPFSLFFLSHDFSNVLSVLPLIVITCVPLPSFMSSFYYQTAFYFQPGICLCLDPAPPTPQHDKRSSDEQLILLTENIKLAKLAVTYIWLVHLIMIVGRSSNNLSNLTSSLLDEVEPEGLGG